MIVIHERKEMRLREYDYSQQGSYFVTICIQNRECLLGKIVDGNMMTNDAGQMIDRWWQKLFQKFSNFEIDNYVIMPNHFHGILNIVGTVSCNRQSTTNNIVGAIPCNRPNIRKEQGENMVSPLRLGEYISWFKRMSTNEYIRNVKQKHWPSFEKRLWQRNYYEHVVRDENDLTRIQEYIQNNPKNWEKDKLYEN